MNRRPQPPDARGAPAGAGAALEQRAPMRAARVPVRAGTPTPAPAGALPGVEFPDFAPPDALRLRDLVRQFAASYRMPREALERAQAGQLRALLAHAARYSTHWSRRLPPDGGPAGAPAAQLLEGVPGVTRADLQDHRAALQARFPGREQAALNTTRSSGSTGAAVEVVRLIPVQQPLFLACQQFYYALSGFDPSRRTGVLRSRAEDRESTGLGTAFAWMFGAEPPAFSYSTKRRSTAELYALVERQRPHTLICGPTTARRLAEHARERGGAGLRVDTCFTLGSAVTPELREIVREGLGARILDNYSAEETGWIAVQCQKHDHYHVIAPLVHVEIVDAHGVPCGPGTPGRVLVTVLHSYAMPLVRYEIGDVGEWGEPCDCGSHWPVLRRIVGRTRHLIEHPDGTRSYPRVYARDFTGVPGLREYRLTLHADRVVVAQVLMDGTMTAEHHARLVALVQAAMGYPYRVKVRQVREIRWDAGGKQDDFGVSDAPSSDA